MSKHKLPSIYFLHIPKTAGSSLNLLILGAYPKGSQLKCSLSQLLQMSREEINKFKCFSEHWGTGLFSLLNKNISSVTMLREPFERTISGILFGKRTLGSLPSVQDEFNLMSKEVPRLVFHRKKIIKQAMG